MTASILKDVLQSLLLVVDKTDKKSHYTIQFGICSRV